MPFGVSDSFLDLADSEPRRAVARSGVAALLGLFAFLVAELADPARAGPFTWTFVVTAVVALVAGGLWSRRRTMKWGDSLRTNWSRWNEAAIGAGSMAETAARVDGDRVRRGRWVAIVAGVAAIANGALAIAAWNALPPTSVATVYGAFAYVVTAATGVVVGAGIAVPLLEASWARSVGRATKELVREGRIGVWGVR